MRLGHPIRGSICSAMEVDFIFASGKAANAAKNSWIFKYTNPAGEKKKLGLGVDPDVGLAQAREAALGMRQLVSAGKGPKDNPNRPADPAGHHRIADVRRHFHQGIRTVGVRRAKCWLASPFRDERILNLAARCAEYRRTIAIPQRTRFPWQVIFRDGNLCLPDPA